MKLRTYYLAFRKHTNNIAPRNISMTNKVIRNKSRCSEPDNDCLTNECLSDKSRFMKQKHDKK